MMTTTEAPRRRATGVAASTVTLGVVVSLVAVAAAVALRTFAGVSEGVIVLMTIGASSVVGWLQPQARLRPAPVRRRH